MRVSRGGPSGWKGPVGCETTGQILTELTTKARRLPSARTTTILSPDQGLTHRAKTRGLVGVPGVTVDHRVTGISRHRVSGPVSCPDDEKWWVPGVRFWPPRSTPVLSTHGV